MGNMRYCPQCGHALEPTARFCENCGAAVSKVPDGQKNETEKVFTPRRSGETAGRVAGNPPQRRPLGDADTTQTGAAILRSGVRQADIMKDLRRQEQGIHSGVRRREHPL